MPRTVGDLSVRPPKVSAATSLAAALHALTTTDSHCLPVLD
ncbi:hypothetical protein, partial [Frankia sp. AvcI1]